MRYKYIDICRLNNVVVDNVNGVMVGCMFMKLGESRPKVEDRLGIKEFIVGVRLKCKDCDDRGILLNNEVRGVLGDSELSDEDKDKFMIDFGIRRDELNNIELELEEFKASWLSYLDLTINQEAIAEGILAEIGKYN